MLTTLPNRLSALLSDPLHVVPRGLDAGMHVAGNGELRRALAPLSIWDDGSAAWIEMDVPGVALSDLEVSVENGKLTVRGLRKLADRHAESLYDERFFGHFERTIKLPEWTDASAIEATLRDGVLRLRLGKKPEAQRQRIVVRCADEVDGQHTLGDK